MSAERVGITKARKIAELLFEYDELLLEYDKRRERAQECEAQLAEAKSQLEAASLLWTEIIERLGALGVSLAFLDELNVENILEDVTPEDTAQLLDSLPAHVQRAFHHVQTNPGITAHKAAKVIGNKRALYDLARLGLIDKRGSAFFPKVAACDD